ncbi:ATP-binding protein [Streptomyces sp. NPDC020801]|uniref:ATP-binding protein n=1 Tax=unclassified Streptomyces TaxID=2593676 RepID=UPI0037B0B91F
MPPLASPEFGSSSAAATVAPWVDEAVVADGLMPGARAVGAASFREPDVVTGALAAAALRIDCGREGFARAREFTRRTLRGWSLDHCGDDAALVVTELAANAATHAVPFAPVGDADVWLGLVLDTTHLVLTVSDPCDSRPVPAPATGPGLPEHGRGLCIVDALAEQWGWAPRPPAGKTVWAKLPTRPPR